LSNADILRTRERIFQMRTAALYGAKNFGFFEIFEVSAPIGGGGVSQCGHFSNKGGPTF